MPISPSSSPPKNEQSNALLPTHPGWIIAENGIGFKSDSPPQITVYSIIFWADDALPSGALEAWQQEKKSISEAMTKAGIKGAYGKLRTLAEELRQLFIEKIEFFLRAGAGTHAHAKEAHALACELSEQNYSDILAWGIYQNHVHVLLELSSDLSIDDIVTRWQKLMPGTNWAKQCHVEALKAQEANAHITRIIDKLGAPIPESQVPDQAEATEKPDFHHITVLLHETVELLAAGPDRHIIDCTLGGGGHTELLLEQGATVWGIDRDPEARRAASHRLARFGNRFKVLAGNFNDIETLLTQHGLKHVHGILADLGVSSHQLDKAERGFSFREDGPLDMRMDTRAAYSAQNLVNEAPESELADILWQFGEERASRAIARAIVKARQLNPITTTGQLAHIIESVLPRKGRQHPGTRSFQAIRIAVNGELDALDSLLDSATRLLYPGGRLAIITFHSLEDRRVKQFFDRHSKAEIDRPEWPAPRPNPDYCFRQLTKKPIIASDLELSENPRSRSAKLRGVEKIN